MRKMVLGMSIVLTVLGFCMSPAMAEPGSPQTAPVLSAADQAFLASLAARRPLEKEATPQCSASVDCLNGTTLSCTSSTGTSSCSSVARNCADGVRGSVTCDGVTSQCPMCFIADTCSARHQQCQETCAPCPIRTFQCNPYVCECVICP